MNEINVEDELKHWGILGMHWGIRRYQNPDGSLTPEGRERYLKNPNDKRDNSYNEDGKKKFIDPKYFRGNSNNVNMQAVTDALHDSDSQFSPKLSKMQYDFLAKESKNNNYGISLYSTILSVDNKDFKKFMASDDHSRETLKKYLDSKWPFTFNDSDINSLHNYITNLDKFNNEGKEFFAKQVDKLGVSDSKRDYLIKALYDEYIDPVAGVQIKYEEDELKHWGILGMKWGIRNYQNPDGSLTPLGRIRYGVGAKKDVTGNIAGINDANSLSDEELKRMTKRYQQQADYYQARNNYIYQERNFKNNIATPKKERKESGVGRFMKNVFGAPLEQFLAKNVQFGLGAIGYNILNDEHPEMAAEYFKSVTGVNKEYKKPDKLKDATEEARKQAEYYKQMNILKENKKKYNDPYSDYNEPKFGKGNPVKQRQEYYTNRKNYEDLMNKKINDLMNNGGSNQEIQELINEWKFIYGKDMPLNP